MKLSIYLPLLPILRVHGAVPPPPYVASWRSLVKNTDNLTITLPTPNIEFKLNYFEEMDTFHSIHLKAYSLRRKYSADRFGLGQCSRGFSRKQVTRLRITKFYQPVALHCYISFTQLVYFLHCSHLSLSLLLPPSVVMST